MKRSLQLVALTAPLLLNSCFSVCWLSLNLADTYLHKDTTVVVFQYKEPGVKYEYKGKDWHPMTLACATDKGKGIIRKGDGIGYCLQDTSKRFEIQEGTQRSYLYSGPTTEKPDSPREIIPEEKFKFAAARKRKAMERPICRLENPYIEFPYAAPGMPRPQKAPSPALWEEVVATPLFLLDVTGSIAMNVTAIAVTPVIRIGKSIAGLFTDEKEELRE